MTKEVFIFGEDGFTNITLANSLTMLGFKVIGEVDNENVALNLITHHLPEVVILDLELNHLKSLELAKTLRKRFPEMGLVAISKSDDIRLLGIEKNSLPMGVLMVQISSHADLDNLKSAILKAPKFTDQVSEFQICNFLSDTQVETFRLLAEGKANSEIAKMRYVSEKSVEQMLARIALTLGINFDRKQNTRVRLTNSFFELINGSK